MDAKTLLVACEGWCEGDRTSQGHRGPVRLVRVEGFGHVAESHYCETAIATDRESGFTVTVLDGALSTPHPEDHPEDRPDVE